MIPPELPINEFWNATMFLYLKKQNCSISICASIPLNFVASSTNTLPIFGVRYAMSEFIAFRAANWARRKGREIFSLPSCIATHCGARVALQRSLVFRVGKMILPPLKIRPFFG
jgi:hypothetical protein